ncbi:MAG: alkyl sulfatase dimerization domain-containing protein [Actinomycetes bacterium]
MSELMDRAEEMLAGRAPRTLGHPMSLWGGLAEVADRTAFVAAFSNSAVLETDEGLVVVDTSGREMAGPVHEATRTWSSAPTHTVVFTHGHVDHVFGVELHDADNERAGRPAPVVVGHEAIAARFDRYVETAGYNETINRRQFSLPDFEWPREWRYPDVTYHDHLDLHVGGERIELHHARGETDDHTWVHVPGRRLLCTGDMFIWAAPNCGNPQKVQRYPRDWARGLRAMADCDAEVLLPGHGLPITGAVRVRAALTDSAELLEHLYGETLAMMNAGARLDEIIHTVRAPAHLLEKPYLRPIYDEPEFIVHNIWRLLGGWYDGNPATLKPAPDAAVAAEVAALAGGAATLARRALDLAEAGDLRLAGHLAEWAALAAPDDAAVHGARAEVFERRRAAETSTMARGVFGGAARESRDAAGDAPERR